MALKKKIVFRNGVIIEYHYISDIQVDNKNKIAKIKVDSYTNENYRQTEKNNKNKQDEYENLLNLIFNENQKKEEERDINNIKKWSEEANQLINQFVEDLDLKVASTNIELKNVIDYNLPNLYTLLKNEDLFADAVDI